MANYSLAEARRELAKHGITIVYNSFDEYVVNFKGGTFRTAYFTDDIDDAVDTGKHMAKEQDQAVLGLRQ